MTYETLNVQIEEGIGIITLNRPKVLNSLSNQMFIELAEAALTLTNNNSVGAVIITGGDRVFAAGTDVGDMVNASTVQIAFGDHLPNRAFNLIENMPKPVIAAIAGHCLGGGCELALTADVRIAADNAKIGLPEITLGIIPGSGGTQRLPRLIGTSRAKELIFSGDIINADEAWRVGLVNKLVPAENLLPEAKKWAKRLASRGSLALRMAKTAINEGVRMDLELGLQYEHKCFSALFATEDQKEGMQAFLEKRPPKYQGK